MIALVVCDNIYEDLRQKKALVGLFNNIYSPGFPVAHPQMAVYIAFTDTRPNMKGRLDIVNGESDEVIAGAEGDIPKTDSPNSVIEMDFILNNVVFREPGMYFVRFLINGVIQSQKPIRVIQAGGPAQ